MSLQTDKENRAQRKPKFFAIINRIDAALRWLPILVGVGVSATTLFLWQVLIAQERTNIEQMIQLESSNVNNSVAAQLETRTRALARMAKRWEMRGGTPKREWEADAQFYVSDFGGFQAIEWLDPSFHVRWIVPLVGNEAALNLNLSRESRRRVALETARNRREVTGTRSVNLFQGGKGFLVYVPIFQGEDFRGFILGVFRVQELLDSILEKGENIKRGYSITVSDGEEEIFSRNVVSRQHLKEWGQETKINFHGVTWRIRVWPTPQLLAKEQSLFPQVVLIGGLLMAWLLALAVYLAQKTRQKQQQAEVTNLKMEHEIAGSKRIQETLIETMALQRAILNSANYAIISTTIDGTIATFNAAAQRLLGYTSQEVVGKTTPAIFHDPDEVVRWAQERTQELGVTIEPKFEELFALARRGEPNEREWSYIRKDGSRFPVLLSVTALRDAEDNITGFVGIGSDITERKRAEEQIHLLQTLTLAIAKCVDFDEALTVILLEVCETKGWNYGEAWIPCPDKTVLTCSSVWYSRAGDRDPVLEKFRIRSEEFTFPLGTGLPGRVWESLQPEWQEDASSSPETIFSRARIAKDCGLRAAMGIPLIVNEQVLAVLVFFKFESCNDDMRLVESIAAVAAQLGSVMQRKRMEQLLREREERFQAFMNNSPAVAFMKDSKGRFVYVNEPFERCFNMKLVNLLGKTDFEVWPSEVALQFRENDMRVLTGDKPVEFLETVSDPDGCLRHWLSFKFPCFDVSGQRLLGGVAIDITERQQAETALQQLNEELLQAQKMLQLVMDLVPQSIWWKDRDFRFLGCNRNFAVMAGVETPENIIGKTDYDIWIKENADFLRSVDARVMAQNKAEYGIVEPTRQPNGMVTWLESNKIPLYDEQRRVIGTLGTAQDITERKLQEAALSQANEKLTVWVNELEQRNREIALLSNMSDFLQACLTVEEAYTALAKLAQPLFPQTEGGIYLINTSKHLVEAVATWGSPPLPSLDLFTPDQCWALRRGRVHQVENTQSGMICNHVHPNELPAESLCIPMMAQGEALGVLYLSTQELGRLTLTKQQLASTVAEQIALSLANLKLRQTLQNQSIRDPLTGLFNRRYMEESLKRELHRCKRKQQSLGIIMIDVDHFKRFNDTFGHEAGDAVLRELGLFLQKHIRTSDIACRYGGEELMLILPEASLEITHQRAEQIREGIKHLNVQHHGQPLGAVSLSLGIACFPEHGSTGEAVVRAADAALYRAKKSGRDRVVCASSSTSPAENIDDCAYST